MIPRIELRNTRRLIATATISAGLLAVVVANLPATSPTLAVQRETSPTAAGARFPSLARSDDGRIAMIWSERGADSVPLVKSSIRGVRGGWSAPVTVVRDSGLFLNFADVPRITWLSRTELAVSWLQRSGPGRYDYGVRIARSRDNGATWQPMVSPHDASEKGEHGFVSLLSRGDGRLAVSFLNGRDQVGPGGATMVAYTEYDARGSIARNMTLDPRACDCCQTGIAMTTTGPVVAYRDRSADEIRDIAVSRLEGSSWSEPVHVYRDNWRITGCPVNGPAIVAHANRVAVAWFTGARDTAKVQVAVSTNAGRSFAAPVRVDGGTPVGHVQLQMAPGGDLVVSWLERVDGDRLAIQLRTVGANRAMSAPLTIGEVKGVRPSGWPALVAHDGGAFVAWTESGAPSQVRTMSINTPKVR